MVNLAVKSGYRPQAWDMSVEIDAYQFFLLRQRTEGERLAMAAKLTKGAKSLSLLGIKHAKREHSFDCVKMTFARAVLAEKWQPNLTPIGEDETLWIQDSIELARQLHALLESLEIPYSVTDGVASIALGEPRTTRDLDLVAEIAPKDITRLSNALEREGFYCPLGAIEEIQSGRGNVLSVTHIETILNADIIINSDTPFNQSKMARRRLIAVDPNFSFWVASPEDVILAKLLWSRPSQSENQWRDVLGVLKVQAENLDYGYLAEWADCLGIVDALSQAMTEAGI